MEAVMILRQSEPTWAESKRQLSKPQAVQPATLHSPSFLCIYVHVMYIAYVSVYSLEPCSSMQTTLQDCGSALSLSYFKYGQVQHLQENFRAFFLLNPTSTQLY